MIRHVVFFKFKPAVGQQEREAALAELRHLPSKIDVIRRFEVGRDLLRLPRSWDAVLIAAYDDLDSLKVYTDHPAHQKAAQRMQAICDSIGSVDFEVTDG